MHFVVTAIGSAGDINPMLMIAAELSSRGHDVDFIANAYFEEKVRKAGLNFVKLGELSDFQKAVNDPDLWDKRKSFDAVWRTLKDSIELNVNLIESSMRDDSVLVGSSLAFASRIVQETHRKKMSTVHLSPCVIISACDPMTMPGVSWLSSMPYFLRNAMMSSIDKFWLDKVCKDDLNEIRSKYSLPPINSVMRHWMHSPDQVICGFPSWFAEPQKDWPLNTVLVGFPVYHRTEDQALPNRLIEFLENGDPPIVFTAGSANAQAKEHFEIAIKAAQEAGKRAVLVSAFPEQIPVVLPPDVFHVEYAPYAVLFPKACAVQHHGGIGTSAQALKAGVPQLVIPLAHDQFDNAARLQALGVAKQVTQLSPAAWSEALLDMIHNSRVQESVARTKSVMESAGSAEALAADALEKLAKQ